MSLAHAERDNRITVNREAPYFAISILIGACGVVRTPCLLNTVQNMCSALANRKKKKEHMLRVMYVHNKCVLCMCVCVLVFPWVPEVHGDRVMVCLNTAAKPKLFTANI